MSLPISGFTAVPNPQMLSYMMSQSWIMMYAAGGAWQYGKRRISAMSNEEFNKLLPIDLLKEHTEMLRSAIPTISQSIQDMTPLINTLMTQFGTFINKAIEAIPQTFQNILGTPGGEFADVTAQGGSGGNLPPQMASFLHYFKKLSDATKVDLPKQSIELEGFEDTHEKRLELAAKKKAEYDRLKLLLERKVIAQGREDLRTSVAATPTQLGIGEKARIEQGIGAGIDRRRKAGQSQVIEKRELTAAIKTRQFQ